MHTSWCMNFNHLLQKPRSGFAGADFSIIHACNSIPCLVSPANCPIYDTSASLSFLFPFNTWSQFSRQLSEVSLYSCSNYNLPPQKKYIQNNDFEAYIFYRNLCLSKVMHKTEIIWLLKCHTLVSSKEMMFYTWS